MGWKPGRRFWRGVRAFNAVVSGVSLFIGALVAINGLVDDEVDYPGRLAERLAFSPDGRTVIGDGADVRAGSVQGEVYAWDAATGRRLWTATFPGTADVPSAFTPDGTLVVTVAPERPAGPAALLAPFRATRYTLQFRSVRDGGLQGDVLPMAEPPASGPTSVDVAPDGASVAAAFADRVVVWGRTGANRAWIPRVFRQVRERGEAAVVGAQFTADCRHLVVLSRTGGLGMGAAWADLWDARTGRCVRGFGLPLAANADALIALSPDRRRLATFAQNEAHFTLWDVRTGERLREARREGLPRNAWGRGLRFVPQDGGGDALSVTLVNVRPPRKRHSATVLSWDVGASQVRRGSTEAWGPEDPWATSPDGRFAVTGGGWHDKDLATLRDAHTGRVVCALEGAGGL